jgi:hypothetical protein
MVTHNVFQTSFQNGKRPFPVPPTPSQDEVAELHESINKYETAENGPAGHRVAPFRVPTFVLNGTIGTPVSSAGRRAVERYLRATKLETFAVEELKDTEFQPSPMEQLLGNYGGQSPRSTSIVHLPIKLPGLKLATFSIAILEGDQADNPIKLAHDFLESNPWNLGMILPGGFVSGDHNKVCIPDAKVPRTGCVLDLHP